MSSIKASLDRADREIVAEVQKLHVGAQVYRFLRIALFAFVGSLPLTIDTGTIGWGALVSLATGALETTFRQFYPAFPLGKTTSAVTQAVKDQATQLATAAINAHVEDYQAGLATQVAVSAMLAQAAKLGHPTTGDGLTPSSHPAEPAPTAVDAKPPAASA